MPTPAPFRLALRGALGDLRYVTPVAPRSATGVVARVYAASETEFGLLAPPVALHSPAPSVLAATWVLLRETLLVSPTEGPARAVKEAVAAGVSLANACPYCVEVHGAVLGGVLDGPAARADAEAIVSGRLGAVTVPEVGAVAAWARDGGALPAAVPRAHLPQLLATALAFEQINRVVSVFLGASPMPAFLPGPTRRAGRAVLGRVLRATALTTRPAGADLDLLAPAELPADLDWATGTGALAEALARAGATFEASATALLGTGVVDDLRAALTAAVAAEARVGWEADPTADIVSAVPRAARPAARLAALVAVAAHRVDDGAVGAFRHGGDSRRTDAELVGLVAWAAHVAARASVRALAAPTRSTSGW